jgi:Tfp pilus assembly protein PilE
MEVIMSVFNVGGAKENNRFVEKSERKEVTASLMQTMDDLNRRLTVAEQIQKAIKP